MNRSTEEGAKKKDGHIVDKCSYFSDFVAQI